MALDEKAKEALVRIEFFSRQHGYKLGLAEEKIGVPHHVLEALREIKYIFPRAANNKVYWYLTGVGKSVAGKASRDQPIEDKARIAVQTLAIACPECRRLGIEPTTENVDKARKMKEKMGILGCNEIEVHLLTKHEGMTV